MENYVSLHLFAESLQQKSSSVGIVPVLQQDDRKTWVRFPEKEDFFILFACSCRPTQGPTRPPSDLMPKVKQEGSSTSTRHTSLWNGFTFTCIRGQTKTMP